MEFVSRHLERDSVIPEHRVRLLNSAVNDLVQDPHVLGIYLGGSLARGNEDNYSDIDLRVVVEPEEFHKYVNEKKRRAAKWGKVLFYEDLSINAPYTVVHYNCLTKIDIFYYKPADIKPSIWMKDTRIIKDFEGTIQKIVDESNELNYTPSIEEVEVWKGKVLSYIQEVYKRVMRDEPYYALSQMHSLRWFITNGWNMENGRISNSFGDWARIEGERSCLEKWQLDLLKSWDCCREHQEIMNTLASMLPEILRLNRALSQKVGIDERSDLYQQIIKSVF